MLEASGPGRASHMIVTLAGCSSTAHPRTTAGGRITMSEDDRAQLYGVRRRQRTSTGLARRSVRVHGAFSRMRCRGSSEQTTMQRELHRMGGADVIFQASQESHLGRLVPQEAAARNQKAANGRNFCVAPQGSSTAALAPALGPRSGLYGPMSAL